MLVGFADGNPCLRRAAAWVRFDIFLLWRQSVVGAAWVRFAFLLWAPSRRRAWVRLCIFCCRGRTWRANLGSFRNFLSVGKGRGGGSLGPSGGVGLPCSELDGSCFGDVLLS